VKDNNHRIVLQHGDTGRCLIDRIRLFFMLSTTLGCLLIGTNTWSQDSSSIRILALHAQRYQDHMRNQSRCEVFGEIKNLSNRPLKGVVIELELLSEKGNIVAKEEVELTFRVIAPRNARGELRPVRPQEIGNFTRDTSRCPEKWLEGRIRYRIKNIEWK
jgi:hypothetical protein